MIRSCSSLQNTLKTPCQHAVKTTIVNRVTLRVPNQDLNRSVNLSKELRTQPRSLPLVPVSGFEQISLSSRPNDEAPFHASITVSGEI